MPDYLDFLLHSIIMPLIDGLRTYRGVNYMPAKIKRIFDTDRSIRLGIWGLGRGMSFYNSCRALNFDVVAGCDYNAHMRDNFLKANPGSFATADAEEFLARDFDAVLLATYCPAHADDAIACLKAGKHVLSEVTSFHTMAEGVRLVEAIESSGLVYNLAENYPFSAANMWLARKWREGFFGDLMYAEYEYVHECRVLAYTYIDGQPIQPGNQAHSWRSWLNFHYYNTHSLGPMMHITGLRPTRVTSLPAGVTLAGYPMKDAVHGMGGISPSLINMSNGAVVRNLMGSTTNDTHQQRIWGTQAAAQIGMGGLQVRVGAAGHGRMLTIQPHWDELGELAAKTGHGGGDFWVLYYFARQILTGEPAPFDVYGAADCTIPGLLAYRSSVENGQPYDVPNFRIKKERDGWRKDTFAQPRFDHREGLFPKEQDEALTSRFSRAIRDLITQAAVVRAYQDTIRLAEDLTNPTVIEEAIDPLLNQLPALRENQQTAKTIIERYPDSAGGRVLREMLELTAPELTGAASFERTLRRQRGQLPAKLKRLAEQRATKRRSPADRWYSHFLIEWSVPDLQPHPDGGLAETQPLALTRRDLNWRSILADTNGASPGMLNIHHHFGGKHGIAYAAIKIKVKQRETWDLCLGHDGGIKVFMDRKTIACVPTRINPSVPDRTVIPITLTQGTHTLQIALDTDEGMGWGIYLRFAIPKSRRKPGLKPVFPVI